MQGWDLEVMITVKITGDDSMMFQLQNTEVVEFQAKSIGVDSVSYTHLTLPTIYSV